MPGRCGPDQPSPLGGCGHVPAAVLYFASAVVRQLSVYAVATSQADRCYSDPAGLGTEGHGHSFTVPSRLAEAIHCPSGLKATLSTQAVCPRRVCRISPVAGSPILTVASVPPHASRRPSGLQATLRIPPVGSRSVRHSR